VRFLCGGAQQCWYAPAHRRRPFFMSCTFKTNIQRFMAVAVAFASFAIASSRVEAQFGFRQPSVGGVKIDTEGVVSNPQVG